MRPVPIAYAAFCLLVLCIFSYAKYEGVALFGSGSAPAGSHNGSGGGHGAGFLLGAHK